MPAIKKDATIDDIVNAMVVVYADNKEKSQDEIVKIIMDTLYDYINLDAANDQEKQLAVIEKLLADYGNLWKAKKALIVMNATSLMALKDNITLKPFINAILEKKHFENMSIDQRAEFMLGHIKINSPKAQEAISPVITEDSESTHSRDRSDSNVTMFSDDFDFSNIESQEAKNRKLVAELYRKSCNELFEYCAYLQKTIKQLDISDQDIIKDIKDTKVKIGKFTGNLSNPEHPMDIKDFLNCSIKVVNRSYEIEKIIYAKIEHKEKTNEVLSAKLKSFSKENITYATRVIDALSNLLNFLFTLKEKIKKYFTGESTEKINEKKLMMFHEITGLSKDEANHLDDLHYKVRENAMGLKSKLSELK